MSFQIIDKDVYLSKKSFHHLGGDTKCAVTMTARVDVTELLYFAEETRSEFEVNLLYLISRALNSREEYRITEYVPENNGLLLNDRINPTLYLCDCNSDTYVPVHLLYTEDYRAFYGKSCGKIEDAKRTGSCLSPSHSNGSFNVTLIPWVSYDSIELDFEEDSLLAPTVLCGKCRGEGGRVMAPITLRLNRFVGDSFLAAKFFEAFENEIDRFCKEEERRVIPDPVPLEKSRRKGYNNK